MTQPYTFIDWLWGVGVGLDQLANAVTLGNPDMTISARIGQFAPHSRYWRTLEWMVDWAFYPLQGPYHCQKALAGEWGRTDRPGNKAAQAVLGIGVFVLMIPFGLAGRAWRLAFGGTHASATLDSPATTPLQAAGTDDRAAHSGAANGSDSTSV